MNPPMPPGVLSPWTGRFRDPALETQFREHVWPEWASRLRIVVILAAMLMTIFAYTDYLALGFGGPLYVTWALRTVLTATAFAVAVLTLGPVRPERLDLAMLVLMILFAVTIFLVVGLQNHTMLFEVPGVLLMVLGFYLFVPTRFDVQFAGSTLASVGFLVIGTLVLDPGLPEFVTVAGEVLLCNVLGAFVSVRTHQLHRREYLQLRRVEERARFEELVARLSTRFITLPPEEVDAAIHAAQAEVGMFAGVDRVWVFEFDVKQRTTSCSHEWARPGIEPAAKGMQQVPLAAFPWASERLLRAEVIAVDAVADMPEAAAAERAENQRQGARSVLMLPLRLGPHVVGAIGFHAVRQAVRWSDQNITLLRMAGETIIGVLTRVRADRELGQQTRALEQSVVALERSNAELQQFAYVASHDLQEPLRSISSFSSLLAERYRGRMDDKANEYIGYLTAAAGRMHDLITDLLDYSRLDSRARPFARCRAGDIVARALDNLRASIEEAGAEIVVGTLPEIDGDPSQLVQLFQNLIGNALKFHGERKPRVSVDAHRENGQWRFEVNDNGIGIDPRHAERIFAIFTRLHTPDQYPGTGIGLAVCKRIVERHHGRIWVETNLPHGSSFRFTLPAVA